MVAESEGARRRRRHLRTLFDGVADLYDASRRGYPPEIVDHMVATAGLRPGDPVLEVGCGTGQLTEQLVGHGLAVTAIDIGPAMVAAARRRLPRSAVRFAVVPFEAFEAVDGSFALVVSATAFHWVDPDVRFVTAARLLRPRGWLALLATGERYDDPFGAALRQMWADRSHDRGEWARRRQVSDTEIVAGTGLFGAPVARAHADRTTLPADVVIGVESTRATSLSWSDDARRAFTAEMRRHLRATPAVALTQETSLTMAQVLPPP
ncbi:MAG TPA: class I SAM-dependent methyltransferase [Acidimicrobiales bacterium]